MHNAISSLTAGNIYQTSQTNSSQTNPMLNNQLKPDFSALKQAIQSNNLKDAQQALSVLQNKAPALANNPNGLLAKLSQALSSGNISSAKSVLSSFKKGNNDTSDSVTTNAAVDASLTGGNGALGSIINVSV